MRKTKLSIFFVLISTSLIFTTFVGVFAEVELRDKSKRLNERDIKSTVEKLNLFDKELNEGGDCLNNFVDNGNGTVTDLTTALMWEQKGSDQEKSWYFAEKYIKELNQKKFAGYSDWRIPTIEELYSLLQPNSTQQLYIDPVFDTGLSHCWSADRSTILAPSLSSYRRNLTLDFKKGTFSEAFTGKLPGGTSATNISSFVRAVRSIK